DFTEARAAGYNPGIIRASDYEFYLSVSLPVIDLTAYIPPHALLAWDRHFLQPGQRLTLLISGFRGFYPVLDHEGSVIPNATFAGVALRFKLGFSSNYKPPLDQVRTAFRQHILITKSEEGVADGPAQTSLEEELATRSSRFGLSDSLEDLLDKYLLRLIRLRIKFGLSWAAAEELLWQSQAALDDPENVVLQKQEMLSNADKAERKLASSYQLPDDPMETGSVDINIITTAFAFSIRRLALCARHCVICHKRVTNEEYEALKPYVCNSNLCIFQYYALHFGPSLEYEVATNTETVDLLVSLAYVAAAEGTLGEPFPCGMGLRVPAPKHSTVIVDSDGLCEFDALPAHEVIDCFLAVILCIVLITAMKGFLLKHPAAKLQDMDSQIPPAAWSLLKWCFASCTAHIQELKNNEDFLGNIGSSYRQFRIMTGAPDKEAKFRAALDQESHVASSRYPTIFAFHGSPLKNWHSIIRHGLWYKHVVNGRSYGHGVYFAADGSVSMSTYALPNYSKWGGSNLQPNKCLVLAEIVNVPSKFVCSSPFYVVNNTDWIMCRYLLVDCGDRGPTRKGSIHLKGPRGVFLEQDPRYGAWVGGVQVGIPEPSHHLDKILEECRHAQLPVEYDQDDMSILGAADQVQEIFTPASLSSSATMADVAVMTNSPPLPKWSPDYGWVEKNALDLLPPPTESSVVATMALQRELKAMHKELSKARKQNEIEFLGWYMPSEFNTDNLYQWLIEMHSFDPELPVTKDMKERGVNSVILEIRFPPSFPHSPPFFRVIRPRFLPFSQGGGGHITDGGSICMDLLTSDGWLPSYSVSAILLQIKLAISNPIPRPARLHPHYWDRPYTAKEALNGYTRAAALHGWKVRWDCLSR
ncbi:hypothetical protein EDC04DRAFT_2575002, partial [Pisolithus marmoratus]